MCPTLGQGDGVLTYQIRPRVFKLEEETAVLAFPARCELRFHFKPPQPFGTAAGGGKTCVKAVEAKAFFDANSGRSTVESAKPLDPLEVTIESPDTAVSLVGAVLTVTRDFDSPDDLRAWVESIYFGLPALLNVSFADPPFVERVDGAIAGHHFRWELSEWRAELRTTTQEKQERDFATAWERLGVLSAPGRRRLLAALHYFHVACRLARAGETAGEFVAEVILNLAKTLEVLFPPDGDGKARDAARRGLAALGYGDDEIESLFIPAMALRNEIDVGHVELGLFKPEHLAAIHSYTDRAENAFRSMLDRRLAEVESDGLGVAYHELGPPSSSALGVADRLLAAMPQDPV